MWANSQLEHHLEQFEDDEDDDEGEFDVAAALNLSESLDTLGNYTAPLLNEEEDEIDLSVPRLTPRSAEGRPVTLKQLTPLIHQQTTREPLPEEETAVQTLCISEEEPTVHTDFAKTTTTTTNTSANDLEEVLLSPNHSNTTNSKAEDISPMALRISDEEEVVGEGEGGGGGHTYLESSSYEEEDDYNYIVIGNVSFRQAESASFEERVALLEDAPGILFEEEKEEEGQEKPTPVVPNSIDTTNDTTNDTTTTNNNKDDSDDNNNTSSDTQQQGKDDHHGFWMLMSLLFVALVLGHDVMHDNYRPHHSSAKNVVAPNNIINNNNIVKEVMAAAVTTTTTTTTNNNNTVTELVMSSSTSSGGSHLLYWFLTLPLRFPQCFAFAFLGFVVGRWWYCGTPGSSSSGTNTAAATTTTSTKQQTSDPELKAAGDLPSSQSVVPPAPEPTNNYRNRISSLLGSLGAPPLQSGEEVISDQNSSSSSSSTSSSSEEQQPMSGTLDGLEALLREHVAFFSAVELSLQYIQTGTRLQLGFSSNTSTSTSNSSTTSAVVPVDRVERASVGRHIRSNLQTTPRLSLLTHRKRLYVLLHRQCQVIQEILLRFDDNNPENGAAVAAPEPLAAAAEQQSTTDDDVVGSVVLTLTVFKTQKTDLVNLLSQLATRIISKTSNSSSSCLILRSSLQRATILAEEARSYIDGSLGRTTSKNDDTSKEEKDAQEDQRINKENSKENKESNMVASLDGLLEHIFGLEVSVRALQDELRNEVAVHPPASKSGSWWTRIESMVKQLETTVHQLNEQQQLTAKSSSNNNSDAEPNKETDAQTKTWEEQQQTEYHSAATKGTSSTENTPRPAQPGDKTFVFLSCIADNKTDDVCPNKKSSNSMVYPVSENPEQKLLYELQSRLDTMPSTEEQVVVQLKPAAAESSSSKQPGGKTESTLSMRRKTLSTSSRPGVATPAVFDNTSRDGATVVPTDSSILASGTTATDCAKTALEVAENTPDSILASGCTTVPSDSSMLASGTSATNCLKTAQEVAENTRDSILASGTTATDYVSTQQSFSDTSNNKDSPSPEVRQPFDCSCMPLYIGRDINTQYNNPGAVVAMEEDPKNERSSPLASIMMTVPPKHAAQFRTSLAAAMSGLSKDEAVDEAEEDARFASAAWGCGHDQFLYTVKEMVAGRVNEEYNYFGMKKTKKAKPPPSVAANIASRKIPGLKKGCPTF